MMAKNVIIVNFKTHKFVRQMLGYEYLIEKCKVLIEP